MVFSESEHYRALRLTREYNEVAATRETEQLMRVRLNLLEQGIAEAVRRAPDAFPRDFEPGRAARLVVEVLL